MWDSIWETMRQSGITFPAGVSEVTLRMPTGQEFTVEVPEDLKESA